MLFRLRTSMVNVKTNFSSMYSDLSCNLCGEDVLQNAIHLLDCKRMLDNFPDLYHNDEVQFEDIFSDTQHQLKATRIYTGIFEIKSKIEDDNNPN